MIFIGVDAAWGEVNETGIVALDPSGRVRHAGWATGLGPTVDWICDRAEPDMLVFIDAPLVVTNPTGQRLCETHVGQRYWRWSVAANSTNMASRRLGGVALLTALETNGLGYEDGIDGPPSSGRVVSECYPYTTIVGVELLGYHVRPALQAQAEGDAHGRIRAVRAAACDELIRRVATLGHADPPLDVRSHEATRRLLEEPSPVDNRAYKHREDLLDAYEASRSTIRQYPGRPLLSLLRFAASLRLSSRTVNGSRSIRAGRRWWSFPTRGIGFFVSRTL